MMQTYRECAQILFLLLLLKALINDIKQKSCKFVTPLQLEQYYWHIIDIIIIMTTSMVLWVLFVYWISGEYFGILLVVFLDVIGVFLFVWFDLI